MRGEMVEVKCKCCKKPFMARVADRKRGWGKFCSKSCKAIKQVKRIGRPDLEARDYREDDDGRINRPLSQAELADHGQWKD